MANHKHVTIALISICLTSIFIYLNSLHVPFYFDDIRSISNNQILQIGTLGEIATAHGMRAIAYLSFALDYKISGDIQQFHISNILVHTVNGLLIYLLTYLLTFKTPNKTTEFNNNNEQDTNFVSYLPLVCAIIFIVHPLNSQAVTYIVQRSASLAALFYLATICCYLIGRIYQITAVKALAIFTCLLCFSLALFTKQNTVTIPLTIIAIELIFFNRLKFKHLLAISALAVLTLLVSYLIVPEKLINLLTLVDAKTRENDVYSRLEYLTAQVNILWVYIAKFFVPINLRLEYPYQINQFPLWQSLLASLGHIITISLVFIYRKRFPLISFGIAFYYIAHLVESSIIPIMDLAVEHRNYLPNVGLSLAVSLSLLLLVNKLINENKKAVFLVLSPIILAYALTTLNRNQVWQAPIAFYENELHLSPNSCRVMNNLAHQYINNGRQIKGYELIEKCIALNDGKLFNGEEINNYIAVLINQKRYQHAEKIALEALSKIESPIIQRRIYENLGMMMMQLNNNKGAEHYLKQALARPNPTPKAYLALSVALAQQGRLQESNVIIDKLLLLSPNYQAAIDMKARLAQYL